MRLKPKRARTELSSLLSAVTGTGFLPHGSTVTSGSWSRWLPARWW